MALMTVLLVASSAAVPVALAIGISWLSRRVQDRDGRRSPIEGRTIHGAAEQLRKRVEEHGDELMVSLGVLLFVGPYFLAIWALQRINLAQIKVSFGDYILLAAASLMAALLISRVLHHGRRRRIANAGLKAELYTAQELNRLMALGCTVLHDIPCEQFNIDHVVIGQRGVYAIETKSVRKPAPTGGKDHFKVSYDGQRLHFPGFSDDKRLQQTRRQAEWLASYLEGAVGRKVPVLPALALPGWWIDSTGSRAASDVRVFNPAGRGAEFMADRRGASVDASTAALVRQALVMRYAASADRK
ncbi:nuclease-related domain-containing protein [Lysobacter auxotrophicus]|uniref:NERD domain-containing protein n=1 Tax=Lysobacter auxotrophicus TaxID=2992573 RepID=A0ABN6UPF1_9GAMM|nr:nuclease-related domain-containing protein [Lysobacter auxotrophicus]BDU18275.1 NERD domain-containing protein [Lysobacter auxotrophicus]